MSTRDVRIQGTTDLTDVNWHPHPTSKPQSKQHRVDNQSISSVLASTFLAHWSQESCAGDWRSRCITMTVRRYRRKEDECSAYHSSQQSAGVSALLPSLTSPRLQSMACAPEKMDFPHVRDFFMRFTHCMDGGEYFTSFYAMGLLLMQLQISRRCGLLKNSFWESCVTLPCRWSNLGWRVVFAQYIFRKLGTATQHAIGRAETLRRPNRAG